MCGQAQTRFFSSESRFGFGLFRVVLRLDSGCFSGHPSRPRVRTLAGCGSRFKWNDGRTYIGQYVANQKEGEGEFIWPDGRSSARGGRGWF